MSLSMIQNKRSGGHRFIAGSEEEFVRLFGSPAPVLPEGEPKAGVGEVIQVVLPSQLDTFAGRYLEELKKTVARSEHGAVTGRTSEAETEFVEALEALLKHIARSDRRIGLINLFWLAWGKNLRNLLLNALPAESWPESSRYQLWPLLSGLHQRVQRNAFQSLSAVEKRSISFNLGRAFNWGLVDSLLTDQFCVTERDVRGFEPQASLGARNAAFRIDSESFAVVLEELETRFREDIRRGDPGFQELLRRRVTGFASHNDFAGRTRDNRPFPYESQVVGYYLMDGGLAEAVTKKSMAVRSLATSLGGWGPFVEEFERTLQALRRSEYLQFIQEFITLIPAGLNENDIKELFMEGRLYRYTPNMPVVNNFRRVVIVFADIREFTRTAEMAISERELTERLYDVFDPLAHIVVSLGGTVDKFTGDGMMITFGAVHGFPDLNLRSLRCAIAIQEAVERLRAGGRTAFQMGLSIHAGRVFVANFMHDNEHKETTVIGRQVNLASRLSSTQSDVPGEAARGITGAGDRVHRMREGMRNISPSAVGAVFTDEEGNFFNVGLATSQQFLQDLRHDQPMDSFSEDGKTGYRFYDPYLKGEVIFHYVGEARFKGVREKTPVYGISWRRRKPVEEIRAGRPPEEKKE